MGCNAKNKGIETFNDIFGLDDNWDKVDELERVTIFTEKLNEFNNKSTEEIEQLYYRDDIQKRLEHNYQLCINSFNNLFLLMLKLLFSPFSLHHHCKAHLHFGYSLITG